MAATDTLAGVMDALEDLYGQVHDDLRVYRWRPESQIELPAIWTWMPTPARQEQRDTAQFRDTFRLSAYIGVAHTDDDEEMAQVELYADQFRDVVDPALNSSQPLNDSAVHAIREDLRLVVDRFNEISVLCVEFPLRILVQRIINPS